MPSTYVPCPSCGALNRVDVARSLEQQAACSRCKSPLPIHDAVVEADAAGLAAEIAHSPLPVVVDFWAPWCAPCRAFAPVFVRTANEVAGKAVFAKLDTQAHPEAGARYRIQAIPTLVIWRGGEEVARRSGALQQPAFLAWLQSLNLLEERSR
jgi:thioredoxin 2